MSNISIAILRDDVLDRIDNLVIAGSIPEALRQKMSVKRITRAMNIALRQFTLSSKPELLKELTSEVALSAPTVQGNLNVYEWPATALTGREDAGLLKIILGSDEMDVSASNNTSLESLRFQAGNNYYGDTQKAFHVDIFAKRIYTPKGVTAKARIITTPLAITDGNTYNAQGVLPISEIYESQLSDLALNSLIGSPAQKEVTDG